MSKSTVLFLAVIAAMVGGVAVQWPEIQRYLKVRQM